MVLHINYQQYNIFILKDKLLSENQILEIALFFTFDLTKRFDSFWFFFFTKITDLSITICQIQIIRIRDDHVTKCDIDKLVFVGGFYYKVFSRGGQLFQYCQDFKASS